MQPLLRTTIPLLLQSSLRPHSRARCSHDEPILRSHDPGQCCVVREQPSEGFVCNVFDESFDVDTPGGRRGRSTYILEPYLSAPSHTAWVCAIRRPFPEPLFRKLYE